MTQDKLVKITKVSRYQYRQFWVEIVTEVNYESDGSEVTYVGHVRLGDLAGVVVAPASVTPEAAEYMAERIVDEIHETMMKNGRAELTKRKSSGTLDITQR